MRRAGAAMHRARAHPLRAFRSAVPRCPPIRHLPSASVNGHGYIRLEIKSAIVSPLNELSHAYAYSRSSSTRSGVRVLGPSARSLHGPYLSRARAHTCTHARAHTHTCARAVHVDARNTRGRLCVHPCTALRACTSTKI